jgi:hypothetical protein
MMSDKPSDTFCQLLTDFDEDQQFRYHYVLGPDCRKVRCVSSNCIVIDLHWYPLNNQTHRDWYDITISSIKDVAHFTGSLEEFGPVKELLSQILRDANITILSKPIKLE